MSAKVQTIHQPKLHFISYNGDPTKESKWAENRKTVATVAMLNRPGSYKNQNALPTTKAKAKAKAKSVQHQHASLPRQDSASSSNAAISPPETVSTWSTTSGSPWTNEFELPYHSPSNGYFENGSFENGYFDHVTQEELDNFNFDSSFQSDMEIGSQFAPLFPAGTSPDSVYTGMIVQDVRPLPQPRGRKASNVPTNNMQVVRNAKGRMKPNFVKHTVMTNGATDPFDCLPIKADAHTHELVYMYLHAQLASKVVAQPGSLVLQRLKQSRDAIWWPLTRGSKAALSALSESSQVC